MELVSYLAGERWSDRPSCTHPLLAHLARLVNDLTDDEDRPLLAPHIPSVIGLRGDAGRWDDELTILVASRALPIVSEPSQRALAVGLLSCERMRAKRVGDPELPLHPATAYALEEVPLAHAWARRFVATVGTGSSRHPGSNIIECGVLGMAEACVADPAAHMRELLAEAISLCRSLAGHDPAAPAEALSEEWHEVCQPV